MKKVLLISIDGLGNGGVQSVMMSIVRSLSDKYSFDMVVFHKGDNYNYYENEFCGYGKIFLINRDRSKNIFIRLFKYLIRPFYEYAKYKKIMKLGGYDIVHCHNEEESTIALRAAKKCKIKVRLTHSHNAYDRDNQTGLLALYRRMLRKRISKYSTQNIACSIAAGKSLFNKNHFLTIYNPINLKSFKPSYFCGDENSLNIVNVGRFCEQKNQVFLLDVFDELKRINPATKLTMVGYGNDEYKLKKKVEEKNMTNVFFLPPDSDVAEVLKKNDIFILPSLFEGFPLSLIEAQAIGLKCFASDAITSESDLGNVTFLSLSNSKSDWAKRIIDFWNMNRHVRFFVDSKRMEVFSLGHFSEAIQKVYEDNYYEEQ